MSYDSTGATKEHQQKVEELLTAIIRELKDRALLHDASKLQDPEKTIFDEYTPKLAGCTYGSEEYKGYLAEMDVALRHHYKENRHHPEHFHGKYGIGNMNLIDVIEMICDWKAATLRHNDGDIKKSIEINEKRFNISPQLAMILQNTVNWMEWEKRS
ncbi:MAG: DUF5662 family protein [Candidatus Omnitrophota bacterium]|jgi:hypothetical protein